MIIDGPWITTVAAKIKPDFEVATTLALHWAPASNGTWHATDRSSATDIYAANNVRLYGVESVINNFIYQIEQNRVSTDIHANRLTLSGFNATEHIFGADVDYTGSIYATAFLDRREQGSLKGWGTPLTLRVASTLSFTGTAALPSLRHVDVGVDADADRTIIKQDSYNRTFFYADPASDAGTFTGVFNFGDGEMANLRRFAATQRGAAFTLPTIYGITYPFGSRRGAGPFLVKLKPIEDEHYFGVSRWTCRVTFVEDFA